MIALQSSILLAKPLVLCAGENASVFLLHRPAAARLPRAASRHGWLVRARREPPGEMIDQSGLPGRRIAAAHPPKEQIMKIYREGQSTNPFPSDAPSGGGQEPDAGSRENGCHGLPEGWRRVSTGLHGARLYRIATEGGETLWQAEMALNGEVQRRCFASELHARWWLAALKEPRPAPSVSDWEELNEPMRAGFGRGE